MRYLTAAIINSDRTATGPGACRVQLVSHPAARLVPFDPAAQDVILPGLPFGNVLVLFRQRQPDGETTDRGPAKRPTRTLRPFLSVIPAAFRRGEPLWRETGDGHGTTLVVTDAGLLVIKIEPVVVKTVAAICVHAAKIAAPKPSSQRAGTKQAMLIAMLQRPEGASITEIVEATGWMGHYADVRIMPM